MIVTAFQMFRQIEYALNAQFFGHLLHANTHHDSNHAV